MFNKEHDGFIQGCVTVVRLVDTKQKRNKWRRGICLGGSCISMRICVAIKEW